ncbi:MAG: SAM-dependent DNA methyltransferase, partial [Aristaeellaceae bacterium]
MEKAFVRLVESLCGRKSRWEVWKDMIWLFAACISNAVDPRHREEREKQYMDIAAQYSEAELQTFAELFAVMVRAMEEQKCDFLGGMYMELGLGSDARGQFFTPYGVCRMMARIGMPDAEARIDKDGWVSVNDS